MAICFYGLTRSLQYTYDSIRGNLIQPIIDEGYEVRRPLLPMLCSCVYEFPLAGERARAAYQMRFDLPHNECCCWVRGGKTSAESHVRKSALRTAATWHRLARDDSIHSPAKGGKESQHVLAATQVH